MLQQNWAKIRRHKLWHIPNWWMSEWHFLMGKISKSRSLPHHELNSHLTIASNPIWYLQDKCSNNENENIVFWTAKVLTVDQWKAKHAREEGVPPLSQCFSDTIVWYSDIRLVLLNKFKLELAHLESQEWALCAQFFRKRWVCFVSVWSGGTGSAPLSKSSAHGVKEKRTVRQVVLSPDIWLLWLDPPPDIRHPQTAGHSLLSYSFCQLLSLKVMLEITVTE